MSEEIRGPAALVTRQHLDALRAPIDASQVSWRLKTTKEMDDGKLKGLALAYIDARDVMRRLDEVVGPWNWSDSYDRAADGVVYCTLSIRVHGEWIHKMDGAETSDIEAEKGAISGAFKRAAVKWGIGRELYDIDCPWVEAQRRGKSKVIKPSEHARLAKMLASGELRKRKAPKTVEEQVETAMAWCAARDITPKMIYRLLEKDESDPITESDLTIIRAQARLVNDGTHTPEEAFGASTEQRADEMDARINGDGDGAEGF